MLPPNQFSHVPCARRGFADLKVPKIARLFIGENCVIVHLFLPLLQREVEVPVFGSARVPCNILIVMLICRGPPNDPWPSPGRE